MPSIRKKYDGTAVGQGEEGVGMAKQKGSDLSGQIDDQLRRAFQEVESSPIPDKLLSLLDQLRAQDGGAPSSGTTDHEESSDR